MDTSPNAGPRPFESKEWGSSIALREPHRIWFGFGWQRNGGMLCFLFALALALGSAGVFLEGKGLKANLADVTTCLTGTAVLAVALVLALAGVKLLKSPGRVGVLDLETGSFSAVDQKSGKTRRAFSCGDLYIHMVETPPADGDAGFRGKITIVGPGKPQDEQAPPEVNVTLFHCLPYEDFFKAVRELEKAATWKGLIGSETWINMYRSRQ